MTATPAGLPSDHRPAVLAGFLGWTLDAFDFFLVVMTFTVYDTDTIDRVVDEWEVLGKEVGHRAFSRPSYGLNWFDTLGRGRRHCRLLPLENIPLPADFHYCTVFRPLAVVQRNGGAGALQQGLGDEEA